jgi:tRNA nucleotidyltransferase (CCA-adding enzyme)
VAVPKARHAARGLARRSVQRSRVADVLTPFPPATLWALAAMTTNRVHDRVLDYLRHGRALRPILRGDDLIPLGVSKGPAIGEMLARLRAAKLDGVVRTRKHEESFVRRMVDRMVNGEE